MYSSYTPYAKNSKKINTYSGHSKRGLVTGFCEHTNEPQHPIKAKNFLINHRTINFSGEDPEP
jgi:hypothetical protein